MTRRNLLLVALGLLAALQVVTVLWGRRLRSQYLAQPIDPGTFKVVAVMEGKDEKIPSQAWRGGFIKVVMGGLALDLRDVKFQHRPAIVDTTVALGGVDMKVPNNWTVETELRNSFGGVANSRPGTTHGELPDLLLRGKVIFGGINIE